MSTAVEQRRFRADVVRGLAVHGFLTTPQIAAWTGAKVTDEAMEKRLKRMRAQGLVEERRVHAGQDRPVPCWTLTATGFALTDGCLSLVDKIGESAGHHHLVVAQVGIHLHLAGYNVTTERELRFEEKEYREARGYEDRGTWPGDRRVRIWPNGLRVRYSEPDAVSKWIQAWAPEHRPDLRVSNAVEAFEHSDVPAANAAAWEIELSRKTTRRLENKLAWYATSAAYGQVVYLCGNDTIARAIRRAARQVAPDLDLRIGTLSVKFLAAAVSSHGIV